MPFGVRIYEQHRLLNRIVFVSSLEVLIE